MQMIRVGVRGRLHLGAVRWPQIRQKRASKADSRWLAQKVDEPEITVGTDPLPDLLKDGPKEGPTASSSFQQPLSDEQRHPAMVPIIVPPCITIFTICSPTKSQNDNAASLQYNLSRGVHYD
eukprot:5189972-Pleurochrysis_carterae.AAC.1